MFEKFIFSEKQILKYYKSALRDLNIARNAHETEVRFRFCYDALLKLAITAAAKNNMRVKARQGHHVVLIDKLSDILKIRDIHVIGQEMREKRNWDLYGGGVIISQKEAKEYLEWTENIFRKGEKHLHGHSRLL
jgi:hypothetical protein